MLPKDLEKLVRLFEESDLVELEWEKNKDRIHLKKQGAISSAVVTQAAAQTTTVLPTQMPAGDAIPIAAEAANPAKEAAVIDARYKEVLSPFVGTFYSTPSPDAEPYTHIGAGVKTGNVLCIIEAMKIMNEIEAEFSGKIVDILVKNGQAVQYGQPLFLIEPN